MALLQRSRIATSAALNSIHHHFALLMERLDPIYTINKPRQKKLNPKPLNIKPQYSFALFVIITAAVAYGLIFLELESVGYQSWEMFRSSPYIAIHQLEPEIVWHQLDIAWALNEIAAICIFIVLLFTRDVDKNSQIYYNPDQEQIFIGSKILSKPETKKILSIRRKVKRFSVTAILGLC